MYMFLNGNAFMIVVFGLCMLQIRLIVSCILSVQRCDYCLAQKRLILDHFLLCGYSNIMEKLHPFGDIYMMH